MYYLTIHLNVSFHVNKVPFNYFIVQRNLVKKYRNHLISVSQVQVLHHHQKLQQRKKYRRVIKGKTVVLVVKRKDGSMQ